MYGQKPESSQRQDRHSVPGGASLSALAGREAECALLRRELDNARAGNGRLVFLGGEEGIGKTALARALAHEAASVECRVFTGHCFDLSNTGPYAPWLDIFSGRGESGWPAPPEAFREGRLGRVTDQT